MKRVLIIFLIWFLINLVCSIILSMYIYHFDTQNVQLGDSTPFLFYIFYTIFVLTIISLPTLAFNLFYFVSKKITHKKFIEQLYKTYLIYSIIVCLIISATFFHFSAFIISFIGLFASLIIITIFKFIPGEDRTD